MAPNSNVIICSFYTADDYYRAHGERLAKNLESLGVEYVLREIEKQDGEDWADICRKKVPFLAEVCAANPDKKVFWVDVDCMILELPEYILNSTADIIGFQRGYSSPLNIGYDRRARFWEPSFWGVNITPLARKMIADAADIEKESTVKATDDYFMEEAWRANCDNMTFQLIPSNAVVGMGTAGEGSRGAFFKFGASGNVAEFRGKVEQHISNNRGLKKRALDAAKKIEAKLPTSTSSRLRLIADTVGITGVLTTTKSNSETQERSALLARIQDTGKIGDGPKFEKAKALFEEKYMLNQTEANVISAANSFFYYASKPSNDSIYLAWWEKPFPGNFGDWLSPLIVNHYTDKKILFQLPTKLAARQHMIGLGSIGRFIKPNSVVVGTGISTDELTLAKGAKYVSVRGPVTARVVKESGGPEVTSFGDPGVLISRIFPVERTNTNNRVALVRHFTHKTIPLVLGENMDELDIHMSHPEQIKALVETLNQYDRVVTSAMHIFITCQSYGIPCALITFEGFEDSVHGSGIKYGDYAQGVGLESISPVAVGLNLSKIDFDNITTEHKIGTNKLDEVEQAILKGLSYL
ncbi:MAG: hypothetical protein EBS85_01905 [Micrococcales bacterium]|jgi:hypothetical protein|nr:hypothetical protein [Actinomycetota bacterium]NCA07473.1 hypothetical protein [Micrococcales bacterium]